MLKKRLKYLINVLLIVVIASATLYMLMRGNDIEDILQTLRRAKKGWLVGAVAMVGFFVCSESVIMHDLFKGFKEDISFRKCLLLSNIGFFYSAITPGASGGQPVQIFYMTRCGVDTLVGTLTAMIITIFYKLVLVFLCIAFLIIRPHTMATAISEVPILFAYGIISTIAFVIFLILCIYKTKTAHKILNALIRLGARIHIIKHPDELMVKADQSIESYEQAAIYLRSHGKLIAKIILITLFQRLCFFTATYFVLHSLLPRVSWFDAIASQIVLAFAVDVLPLPGATGANESVFVLLLGKFLPEEITLTCLLLNRGITYYLLTIVTGIVSAIGHFFLSKESPQENTAS